MQIVLWKRLDLEGYDACRFEEVPDGFVIEGAAVFEHNGAAARLAYRLDCDQSWSSRKATVSGWVGALGVEIAIELNPSGNWLVNGETRPDLAGLSDVDLGFTPASNTNAIRRMNLAVGQRAQSIAVWLDTEDWSVKRLPQTCRRTSAHAYHYESPLHGYEAELAVSEYGVIRDYPGLWRMVSAGES